MYPVDEEFTQITQGAHEGRWSASAWYDGEYRGELALVGSPRLVREFDGNLIRSSTQITVDDPDGQLAPTDYTSTLAPFGQYVSLQQTVTVGRGFEASIPLGDFVVTDPGATGGWRRWRQTHLPTGGTVTVSLADVLTRLERFEVVGLQQAPRGATIRSEVLRMLRGIAPVAADTIPTTTVPASKAVHPQSRVETVQGLLELAGLVPGMNHNGMIAAYDPTRPLASPDWVLGVDDMVSMPRGVPTDEGLHNAWEVTGEQDEDGRAALRAILTEESGPLRYGGPFGMRPYRQSAPIYTSSSQVVAAARTFRAKARAARAMRYEFVTSFAPHMMPLDTIRFPIIPESPVSAGLRMVSGRVVRVEHGQSGTTAVQATVLVDQSEGAA